MRQRNKKICDALKQFVTFVTSVKFDASVYCFLIDMRAKIAEKLSTNHETSHPYAESGILKVVR